MKSSDLKITRSRGRARFPIGVLLILVVAGEIVSAQTPNSGSRQADIWYFGRGAGLLFDGSPLPTPLYDGALNTLDGSAVISDRFTGRLLFYSDGSTVWNAEHRTMPNGTGLLGDESSGQPAMIVPDPANPSLYYLFTTSSNDRQDRTFRYSVVNMSLDGGRGGVSLKNIPLIERGSEKVTATRHCDGQSYWVMTQEWGTNRFFAYPVTAGGIGEPVVSSLGDAWPSGNDVQGTMQFSPDGSTLVVTSSGLRQLAFLDFDLSSGQLTNYRIVASGRNYYGVEFSPDGSKLYAVTLPSGSAQLVQFDLAAGDSAAIAQSGTILYTQGGSWQGGQVQIGPDGAMYVSFAYQRAVGRIAYPNRAGLACAYTHQAIPLSGASLTYGLPNFIDSDLPRVDAGVRGVNVTITPDTPSPQAGGEVTWDIEVCNLGNRPTGSFSLEITLPPTLLYLDGIAGFPLLSVTELDPGSCITYTVRTRLADSAAPGSRSTLCAEAGTPDSTVGSGCLAGVQACATVSIAEQEDPCPTPTLLSTYSDSLFAEGSGDRVNVPVYHTGLTEGMVGPDTVDVLCTYTFESSVLSTENPEDFIDGTALDGWDIEVVQSGPGSFLLRLTRNGGRPLTSVDSLLLILPVVVYMPLDDLSAETTLEVTLSTPDRCFAFDGMTNTIGFDICGLDLRRIEALTGGRLSLGEPIYDPMADHLTLPFALPISSNASISIHSLDGRLLTSSGEHSLPAGEHRLEIENAALPNGIYIIRLTTDIRNRSRTFMVRR